MPAAPTSFTATTASSSEIDLSWSASSGATSYLVEWFADGSTGWEMVGGTSSTSLSHTGLTSSTAKYCQMSASDNFASGDYAITNALTQASSGPRTLLHAPGLSYVSAMDMPSCVGENSTAYTFDGFALRQVGGDPQALSRTGSPSGHQLYEASVLTPAASALYPVATVLTNWSAVYGKTRPGLLRRQLDQLAKHRQCHL